MIWTCLAWFPSLFFIISCECLLFSLTSALPSSSLFREDCDPLPSVVSQKSLLTLSFPRFPMLSRPSLPSNKGWATLSATTWIPTPVPLWRPGPAAHGLFMSEMGHRSKGIMYVVIFSTCWGVSGALTLCMHLNSVQIRPILKILKQSVLKWGKSKILILKHWAWSAPLVLSYPWFR